MEKQKKNNQMNLPNKLLKLEEVLLAIANVELAWQVSCYCKRNN